MWRWKFDNRQAWLMELRMQLKTSSTLFSITVSFDYVFPGDTIIYSVCIPISGSRNILTLLRSFSVSEKLKQFTMYFWARTINLGRAVMVGGPSASLRSLCVRPKGDFCVPAGQIKFKFRQTSLRKVWPDECLPRPPIPFDLLITHAQRAAVTWVVFVSTLRTHVGTHFAGRS